ncbi:MAG: CoA-binding protein [Gemmatimonadota bacterium]
MTNPLQAIFEPRSVAVIGASRNAKKRGYQVVRALQRAGFGGGVYPVHPDGGEILGFPVMTSIDQLNESPDLPLSPRAPERCRKSSSNVPAWEFVVRS